MQCSEDSVDAIPVQEDQTDARPNLSGEPQHAQGGGAPSGPHKLSFVYRMNYPRRGRAIIISNKSFEEMTGMSERRGTDTDAANLYQRFKVLQFDTVLKTNLTTSQMLKLMNDEARRDHSDEACFVCCILSHGEEGQVYGTNGIVAIDQLTRGFKGDQCQTLAGKPKIFVIQACRGTKLDHGTDVEMTDAQPEPMEVPHFYKIPSEADFLMAYSVVPGYFSWRNSTKGSWFIQAFCAVMAEYGEKEEIMTLMTRVNQKVAYDFESNAAKEFMNQKKQIPCIVSMLTKQLYFSK